MSENNKTDVKTRALVRKIAEIDEIISRIQEGFRFCQQDGPSRDEVLSLVRFKKKRESCIATLEFIKSNTA